MCSRLNGPVGITQKSLQSSSIPFLQTLPRNPGLVMDRFILGISFGIFPLKKCGWLKEMRFAERALQPSASALAKLACPAPNTSGIKLPTSLPDIDCCTLKELQRKTKEIKGGTPKFDGRMHFFLHNRLTLSMSGLCYAAWEFYRLGKKAGNGSSRGCARTGLDRVLQSSCQIGQLRLQWQLWVAEILPE